MGGPGEVVELRAAEAAGLLRRFEEDFLPALGTLRGGGEEAFFAASGGEWDDLSGAEFGSFFEGPFEGVEFDDREKKSDVGSRLRCGELFEQGKFDAVARDGIDAGEPGGRTIAQFVELARLRAKDVTEMMRGVAFHDGCGSSEVIDEEAAAHV